MQTEIYKVAQNMKNVSVSFSCCSHDLLLVLYVSWKNMQIGHPW